MTDLQYYTLRTLERIFCVLALLLLMNALLPFLVSWNFGPDLGADQGEGNLRFQVVSLGIYLTAGLALLAHPGMAARLLGSNIPVVALLLLAVFSSFWSPYPDATFRRAFALALATMFAVYLVIRFRPGELLELLGYALVVAALLSFFFSLFTAWGHHHWGPHQGIWRGTFGHKNELGRYMALGSLLFLVLIGQSRGLKRALWWIGLAFSLVLLLASTSKTPLAVMLGLLVVWPLLKAMRAGRMALNVKLPVILIVGFGGLVLLLVNFLATGLEAMGRDMTLTGRTKLWELAVSAGFHHPWFGSGYRAFWTERGAREVYAHLGWNLEVGNGHNGYLDVWLELGFVGLGLFVAMLATAIRRIWRRLVISTDSVGTWYALLLGFLIVYSITEKVILQQSELVWTLFVATLLYLTPRRVAATAQAPPPARAPVTPSTPDDRVVRLRRRWGAAAPPSTGFRRPATRS